MIKKIISFITVDIWQKKESEFKNPKVRWALRPFKIVIYTIQGLAEHQMAVRAAALTFFTLMSLVPIAALVFGVVKGFGLDANLQDYLYAQFPNYTAITDTFMGFVNNMLQKTKGGVVASVGFVVLLWAVVKVFNNIEKAFNNIWEIKKSRPIGRKVSDYIAVIFVVPILLIIFFSLGRYLKLTMSGVLNQWAIELLFALLSMAVIWLMFTLIYYVLPNTRVKFKGALVSGLIAGTAFVLFQWGYFYVQGQLNTYNVVYGSFAAMPLFLLWLQFSWMIMLFGAELSYAYQNITRYEQERESLHMCYANRRKVMLAAMVVIADYFIDSEKGKVSSEVVARELNLPLRIIRDVIFDLERAGFVAAVRSEEDDKLNLYVPGQDVHAIRVCDVIGGVEGSGSSASIVEIKGNATIDIVSRVIDGIEEQSSGSSLNMYISDLIEINKNNDNNSNNR